MQSSETIMPDTPHAAEFAREAHKAGKKHAKKRSKKKSAA